MPQGTFIDVLRRHAFKSPADPFTDDGLDEAVFDQGLKALGDLHGGAIYALTPGKEMPEEEFWSFSHPLKAARLGGNVADANSEGGVTPDHVLSLLRAPCIRHAIGLMMAP